MAAAIPAAPRLREAPAPTTRDSRHPEGTRMAVSGKDLVFFATLGLGAIVETLCAGPLAPTALEAAQAAPAPLAWCEAAAGLPAAHPAASGTGPSS